MTIQYNTGGMCQQLCTSYYNIILATSMQVIASNRVYMVIHTILNNFLMVPDSCQKSADGQYLECLA